jgi:ribosomal protein S18 acetylase RimI-like enzyme
VPYRLPSDWRVLRDTIIKSLEMSPDAFLITLEQVEGQGQAFWEHRLRSAQWAVVKRGGQTLGIAAAKPPVVTDGYAVPGKACFIESVWIDPWLREHGVGRRLVTYLIERQRQAGIQEFYLWVFNDNSPAIRFYDRMDFKRTGRDSELPETQFLLEFDSDLVDDEELQHNRAERATDKREFGITYRMLAANP